MMVHFRSRFSQEDHQRINASIIATASGIEAEKNEDSGDDDGTSGPSENSGK